MLCVKRHKCSLKEIVEEVKNLFHEPKPDVSFRVHQLRWFRQQDEILEAGDSLDYDGPML